MRETFRLSLATGLLVEEAYPLHTAFCDALTEAFGAEFLSVTFANPEETADRVNTWVAAKTEDRITDLVSPDSLLPDMRLILANAVYFNARWADQFAEEVTRSKPFHLLPGYGHREREAGISLPKYLWDNDLATPCERRVSLGVSERRKSRYPLGLREKHAETERSGGSAGARSRAEDVA